MKASSLAGLIPIVAGVLAMAFQGISYATHKKVLDVGPLQATKAEHKTIVLPPILGGLALVGGIVLLTVGARTS